MKVATERVALLVTRCPGCGRVTVYLGRTKLRDISLDAARVHRQVRIPVAQFRSPRSGRMRIVVTSRGKPVSIDGLGTSTR